MAKYGCNIPTCKWDTNSSGCTFNPCDRYNKSGCDKITAKGYGYVGFLPTTEEKSTNFTQSNNVVYHQICDLDDILSGYFVTTSACGLTITRPGVYRIGANLSFRASTPSNGEIKGIIISSLTTVDTTGDSNILYIPLDNVLENDEKNIIYTGERFINILDPQLINIGNFTNLNLYIFIEYTGEVTIKTKGNWASLSVTGI